MEPSRRVYTLLCRGSHHHHDYNNPQTSIDILNSNRPESVVEDDKPTESISEEISTVENSEDIPVFGDDLDVPTYLRNRLGD